MEGGGIITLLGMLLLLPFALLRDLFTLGRRLWLMNAQRQRFLTPHELNLRRAAQPVGSAAVLLAAWRLYGPQLDHARVAYAVDWRLIAALASIAVIVGASSFFVGARRCAGLRDGILTTRAAFRIGIGLALCFWLARIPLRAFDDEPLLGACVWQTALLLGLWFLVTGCVRCVLLTVPVSGALAKVRRWIDRNRNQWRSARRT
jgi:hypothetical protein